MTTCYNKITLPGAPTRPTASGQPAAFPRLLTPLDYNLVDQLGKNHTQIFKLDLLHSFPQHWKVLDQALMETIVPNNIDVA